MRYSFILLTILSVIRAEMVPQCTCDEFIPCKNSAVNGIIMCADQCKNHTEKLGARYSKLRECLLSSEPMFKAMLECQAQELKGACANERGRMVPRRYPETMKLAAFTEINAMISRSGLQNEVKKFMATGRKFTSCIIKCSERGGGSCMKKLKCGLDLPSDTELVQLTKRCAINGGFNTSALQNLCRCIVDSGVSSLAPICPRIQIS